MGLNIPTLDKACFCLSLKTGTIIIGVFNLVSNDILSICINRGYFSNKPELLRWFRCSEIALKKMPHMLENTLKNFCFQITCFIAIFVGAAGFSATTGNNNEPRIEIDDKKGTMAIYTTDQTALNGSKIIRLSFKKTKILLKFCQPVLSSC